MISAMSQKFKDEFVYSRYLLTILLGIFVSLFWSISPAMAHKASDAYLLVNSPNDIRAGQEKSGDANYLRISLALKDIDAALPSLDSNDDRSITWAEIKAATPEIIDFVGSGFQLTCAQQILPVAWRFAAVERRSDGVYVRLASSVVCNEPANFQLNYVLFRDIDPTHRLVVSGQLETQPVAAVVAPANRAVLALRSSQVNNMVSSQNNNQGARNLPQGPWSTLAHFFPEGIHHILTGYDHLAFLLTLLLSMTLFKTGRSSPMQSKSATSSGLMSLLRTITAFTIGHSATLIAASLGWVGASAAWVEPAIALTIAMSAGLNIFPVPAIRTDWMALGFGLVHGLGFSGVMTEAGISGSLLVWGLAGFNLGVEAGQLCFLLAWCAIHWLLLRWKYYYSVIVKGGSAALMLIALFWIFQRLA